MSVTIKASLYKGSWRGNPIEIRRFSVDEGAIRSYGFLLEQVAKVFPSVAAENIALAWIDEDGDTIMISSDDELAQALDHYKGKLFRLYVKADLAQSSDDPNDENSEPKGPVHPGVICDGCNSGIYGSRFKCLICADYDLCSGCEGKGIHGDHNMVELERPFQFGQFCGPPFAGGWFGQPGEWRSGGCHRGGRGGRRGNYGGGGGPWSWNPFSQGGSPYRRWGAGSRCGGGGKGEGEGPCFPGEGRQCKPPESKPREDQSTAEPEAMDTDQKGNGASEDERRKYLRNVGSAVSSFLEPFGIKVDVDVVGDDKKAETAGPGASEGGTTATVSEETLEIALAQLRSMGYEDEGGWLTELIKAKGGDVAQVLDALHPAADEPEATP